MAPSALIDYHKAQRHKIVDMIYKKRRILFDRQVDMQTKTWAWEAITAEAQKFDLFPAERDYLYLRDTRWQNWRKRILEKYKRSGGKIPRLQETDKMIFEIVQDFFPKVLQKARKAINFDESDDTTIEEDSEAHGLALSDVDDPIKVEDLTKDVGAFESVDSDGEHDEPIINVAPPIVDKESERLDENVWSGQNNGPLQLNAAQNHAMEAMKMEMTEMQNYKMKLELIKMERELYLKPSKYTKDIVAEQSRL